MRNPWKVDMHVLCCGRSANSIMKITMRALMGILIGMNVANRMRGSTSPRSILLLKIEVIGYQLLAKACNLIWKCTLIRNIFKRIFFTQKQLFFRGLLKPSCPIQNSGIIVQEISWTLILKKSSPQKVSPCLPGGRVSAIGQIKRNFGPLTYLWPWQWWWWRRLWRG